MFGGGGIHYDGVYPLDSISQACSAAYAFRLLRRKYTGKAFKVRRSSDSTTQDIGFAGTEIDLAALNAFVGANSGFVDTWYDQSGNGYNLTQATTSLQPRIMNAGVLDTKHGFPTTVHTTSAQFYWSYATATNILNGSHWSCLSYAYAASGSNTANTYQGRAIWEDNFADTWQAFWDGSSKQYSTGNQNDSNKVSITVTYPVEGIFTSRFPTTGTTFGSSINGSAGTEQTAGSTTTSIGNPLFVGSGTALGANARFDGSIGELIFYNVAITKAQMNTMGAALAPRWAQTWVPMA